MIDEQIVMGLQHRDKGAFEHFWSNYYHRIYPICAFILGDGPDAVDMTVDILVDFVEKYADGLTVPKAMYSFLRQMAVRRSIRLRDKRDKMTCLERDSQMGGDETTPEDEAEMNQLMPFLNQCLENMTPKTQIALRLKYANKISNEQIGHLIGGSKSYIGRILNKGRDTLRKCIEKKAAQASLSDLPQSDWSSRGLKPAVGLSKLDTLLSERPRMTDGDCGEILIMATAATDISNKSIQESAASHLAQCAECRQASIALETLDAGRGGDFSNSVFAKKRSRIETAVWKATPFAAAASALLALSLLWMLHNKQDAAVPPTDDLAAKGGGDALLVAAQRGASKFTVHSLDQLMTGDKLGLFYSAGVEGRLAIFSRDAKGEISRIYPTQGTLSAKISTGEKVPLSDGAVVAEGTGCEWLIGVFSDRALELSDIEEALRSASTDDGDGECGLKVSIPTARNVRILPIKR